MVPVGSTGGMIGDPRYVSVQSRPPTLIEGDRHGLP